MKKLISVGVVLALLAMVVMPGAVAAQVEPDRFGEIPLGILATGITLVGDVLAELGPILEGMGVALPIDLADLKPITEIVASWVVGPLGWLVDLLAGGLVLTGDVVAVLDPILEGMGVALPFDLGDLVVIFDTIADGLRAPFLP